MKTTVTVAELLYFTAIYQSGMGNWEEVQHLFSEASEIANEIGGVGCGGLSICQLLTPAASLCR